MIFTNLYSYYFTGTFWSLKCISSLSFGLTDLKFSAKFDIVQMKTVVKFVFGSHPHGRC